MKIRNDYWHLVVLLLNVLVAIVVFGDWFVPFDDLIVFIYLLFCPGLSLAFIIPTKDFFTQVFLIIVISIGIDVVVAELVLYMGPWSPYLVLVILMGVCLFGTIFEFLIKLRLIKF